MCACVCQSSWCFKVSSCLSEPSSHSDPGQPDGDEVASCEFVSCLFVCLFVFLVIVYLKSMLTDFSEHCQKVWLWTKEHGNVRLFFNLFLLTLLLQFIFLNYCSYCNEKSLCVYCDAAERFVNIFYYFRNIRKRFKKSLQYSIKTVVILE